MGAYLAVRVEFRAIDKVPNIEKRMHELYKEYGMEPVYIYSGEKDIFYEEAVEANQTCFDELIELNEWKHYRIEWKCDWVSFMDTFPCIHTIMPNYENDGRPYYIQKEEWLLFPEDEINDDIFNNILDLITDMYKFDFVHSVKIEKEE